MLPMPFKKNNGDTTPRILRVPVSTAYTPSIEIPIEGPTALALISVIVAEGKGVKYKKTPAKSLGPKAVGKNYKNGYYGK